MTRISRRTFVALAATGTATASFAPRGRAAQARAVLTAEDIVDRIKKNVGVEWRTDTVDTFKAGDPTTVVTGIVTTAMATMDVLARAVGAKANLVITYEPTFYSRADASTPAGRGGRGVVGGAGGQGAAPPSPDPVFAAKNDFIKRNNLVVWRFSDHWRLRKPDPRAVGLTDALGWSKYRAADDPARVTIPSMTLDALVSDIKKKINGRGGIRVVGDPRMNVQRVGLLPGTTAIQAALTTLPTVDVVIAGEVREWESVEYARDLVTAGQKKALVTIGRVLSGEPGMNVCARWLETIVPELTTRWIPVGDPYWSPA